MYRFLFILFLCLSAEAATFRVTITDDLVDANIGDGICAAANSSCTLRAAIQEANSTTASDTILLPLGNYNLTIAGTGEDLAARGDLDITEDLIITGIATDTAVIDAVQIDRVFDVLTDVDVNISNLTIKNGKTTGDGGAIQNLATTASLTISAVKFTGNEAVNGGAVFSRAKNTFGGCTFNTNEATNNGGAININSTKENLIAESDFTLNKAANGGSIFKNGSGKLQLNIINAESEQASTDGGAVNIQGSGNFELLSSNFKSNKAVRGASLSISNTGTVAFEDVKIETSKASNQGAGVYFNGPSSISLLRANIKNNTATNDGGGIYLTGASGLTILNSIINTNTATTGSGGGLYLDSTNKNIRVTIATVLGNFAGTNGGGIFAKNYNIFDVDEMNIMKNTAGAKGGGLHNTQVDTSSALFEDCTFSENTVTDGEGGAVYTTGTALSLFTTIQSLYANNKANGTNGRGGALYLATSNINRVHTSTLSTNNSQLEGGAIYAAGRSEIKDVTFALNSSTSAADLFNNSALVEVQNTILADNASATSCAGTLITSLGSNMNEDNSCAFAASGDVSVDPQLKPLASNGGVTKDHTFVFGSPAIDSSSACLALDQRATVRPFDGDQNGSSICDVGAIEYNDLCPFDDSKTSPGTCGCGTPDDEANGNLIADCLVNNESNYFSVQLIPLITSLKQRKVQEKGLRKSLVLQIKENRKWLIRILKVSEAKINLRPNSRSVAQWRSLIDRRITALLNSSNATFKTNKRLALRTVKEFQSLIILDVA